MAGADCIHVVEDGRITESWPPEALLEENGTYASLYATQRATPIGELTATGE